MERLQTAGVSCPAYVLVPRAAQRSPCAARRPRRRQRIAYWSGARAGGWVETYAGREWYRSRARGGNWAGTQHGGGWRFLWRGGGEGAGRGQAGRFLG